jgi:hypothetical protein
VQEQQVANKKPSQSEITRQKISKAYSTNDLRNIHALFKTYIEQDQAKKQEAQKQANLRAAEQKAERQAQARAAEEDRLRSEDSTGKENLEEFAEEVAKVQPDDQFRITMGRHPAKTTGLSMEGLIRQGAKIEKVRYVSPEDGIVNQFSKDSRLQCGLKRGTHLEALGSL